MDITKKSKAMSEKIKEQWATVSPDGVAIEQECYHSQDEALEAGRRWCTRYERQGYYSSNQGRIPLDELPSRMRFLRVKNKPKMTQSEVVMLFS